MDELLAFFHNSDFQRLFGSDFLEDTFNKLEKPFCLDEIKENCNVDYYNLSLFKERLVLLPFNHWVEIHTSSNSIPQNVCWISPVSLNIYPNYFVDMINDAYKNIMDQTNKQVCFLESKNIHGRALFYFFSKEVDGTQHFNAHLILDENNFDFLVTNKGYIK